MAEKFEALNFVFGGYRESKGRLYMAVAPLRDGEMLRTAHYPGKSKRRWVIGGIYSGAEFSDSSVKGLEQTRYEEKWSDTGLIIEWQALSEQAEATIRCLKVETDARKRNEIEASMLTLRQQYARLLKQRDKAGAVALEEAVIRALRAPVRAAERELR